MSAIATPVSDCKTPMVIKEQEAAEHKALIATTKPQPFCHVGRMLCQVFSCPWKYV